MSDVNQISLTVIFYNVGGYHLARLEAVRAVCMEHNWEFSAIQICSSTTEHPWGDIGIPEYLYTLETHMDGSSPSLSNTARLLEALNDIDPTHVAIPGWGFDFSRQALRWCRKRNRVPILMSESKLDDAPRRWWKELYKRWTNLRHFPAAMVGGTLHQRYLETLGIPKERITKGYDVVDNEYFGKGADEFRKRKGDEWYPPEIRGLRSIVAVNRFIPRKNLLTLIRAFEKFLRSGVVVSEHWRLALLGNGKQRAFLVAECHRLGIDSQVVFPGFQSYSQMPRWYAAAEVFVHPAEAEQWGLVVNEAMASGVPCIVSRSCGCFPDLIEEGKTGMGFAPHDQNELTEQLIELATNDSLRKNVAEAGQAHIQTNFSPRAFGEGLRDAINRVPQHHRPERDIQH